VKNETITSRANPLVKLVRDVRARKREDLVIVEGERLVGEVLALGLAVEVVLARENLVLEPHVAAHPALRRASADVCAAASGLDNGPGLVALVAAPPWRAFDDTALPNGDALVLCVSGVSDPGNLGALARSAEAAGAAAIAVAPGGAHPFGDKALRGSMGSLLRLPVLRLDDARAVERAGFTSVVAATRGGTDFRTFDWKGRIALWVTGETGAASVAPPANARAVTIAMHGAVESLNAACAATLLLFEAARAQRGPR
jgi:TrmH family RNA methyltransferase